MKKILIILGFIVCGYVVAGVFAGYALVAKIEDAERKLPGIGLAISRIAADQLLASERMKTITSTTLGAGGTKIEEVAKLLEDPDLNRLALTYLGSDWSIQRSCFLGNVKQFRDSLQALKDEYMREGSRLNKKITELENRKRHLQNQLKTPRGTSADRAWHVEMDDVERQLFQFRSSNTYREYVEKDDIAALQIKAKTKNEQELFRLANQYQASTIGTLNHVMAEELGNLRLAEAEPSRLRLAMSWFNIWPINMVCRMPVE